MDFAFLKMHFRNFANGFSILGNGFAIYGNAFKFKKNGKSILEMLNQFLEMNFCKIKNPFPFPFSTNPKFQIHFPKFKIHLQKLKIISEIHGNTFAKSMIFFTVKHFLNTFPKPQNQNAFFFPGTPTPSSDPDPYHKPGLNHNSCPKF
jgi:hypothetical protein